MIHNLKIERRWLDRIVAHEKTAEVRINDRDFQAGDTIQFHREDVGYTGVVRRITHVLSDVPGLGAEYVVLSLADGRVDDAERRARKEERANAPLRGTITRLTRERDEARAEATRS
ncbi:DUF3850 domain-containing protein [Tsukamurella pseudospumae]|uniref:DUF3850 domain-containing protein n=1 Tax=Tsukamurella pseudospumae TaxID=239498 RepID=A0A137ZRR7_9ACTN|nr:DUF3850 domain-containing protein [Tsukamurella pseudospumae]KXP00866.1 hypothetical protein AXK61_12720 [Tsukamurella pseudospumae]